MPTVGRNVPRRDGMEKVTGAARYVDDLVFPGMLLRPDRPVDDPVRAHPRRQPAVRPGGVHRRRSPRHPGRNVVALIVDDQPCLAEQVVRHFAEPILLLAHEDRERLIDGRRGHRVRAVRAGLRPAALRRRSSRRSPSTRATSRPASPSPTRLSRASTASATRSTSTSRPTASSPFPENGGVTVYGSLQCPYYVQKALCVVLGLPPEKVRVVQAETGGGFGGKEEYPSILAAHASLLALKSGRPVKMVYDRAEDMEATTKRHPAVVRTRTGVTRDGRLTAIDVDVAARRRRLHDAEPGRADPRRHPRQRALSLRQRPGARPRRDDEHPAERRVPRLRRAADAVRRPRSRWSGWRSGSGWTR